MKFHVNDLRSFCYTTEVIVKDRPEKFTAEWDLNDDLCDAGVVFYQLNYQANWELGPISRKSRNFMAAFWVT